ncbi:MAG: MBL fold metallo-hydrolase [Oscillospiraceae bacterium]|nr:MBL fold metallo-hydrolase [Oscillospiraceae bacterium]
MTLSWYGHSSFKLDFNGESSVIFDPYASGSVRGIDMPSLISADEVLCSHDHKDHNARHRVNLTGKLPAYETKVLYSFHDKENGKSRGPNKIHIVSYGDFRAAHFGDQGCIPDAGQLEQLKNLDLALIPIGGVYTLDPAEAKELIGLIQPRITVPMHYRIGKRGLKGIAELSEFTSLFDAVYQVGGKIEIAPGMSGIYCMDYM